jgi:hypothetical protein
LTFIPKIIPNKRLDRSDGKVLLKRSVTDWRIKGEIARKESLSLFTASILEKYKL